MLMITTTKPHLNLQKSYIQAQLDRTISFQFYYQKKTSILIYIFYNFISLGRKTHQF